jgi:hypothetical protein
MSNPVTSGMFKSSSKTSGRCCSNSRMACFGSLVVTKLL